jgi:predicted NBD/HSP70 family sugar kinase
MSFVARIIRVMEIAERLGERCRKVAAVDEDETAATTAEKASPGRGHDDVNLLTVAERTTRTSGAETGVRIDRAL